MPKTRTFLPYTKARSFARSLRLKNRTQWREYAKQHKAHLDALGVPAVPEDYYRSDDERHLRATSDHSPPQNRPLSAAKAGQTQERTTAAQRRPAPPPKPPRVRTWINWHDWLGSSYAPRMTKDFASRTEFTAFLKKRHISTQAQYQRWRKKYLRSPLYHRMPGSPASVYTSFSWKTVSPTMKVDGSVTPQNKGGAPAHHYAPFSEVRREVRALKLNKREHWVAFVRDHSDWLREHNCPSHPERVAQYSERWHGWADFLNKDTRALQRYKRD